MTRTCNLLGTAGVVLTAAGSLAVAGSPLLAGIDRYAGRALDGPGQTVTGLSVTVGHLELELTRGGAARIVADGRVVGLFFHGDGRARYVSERVDEAAVMRRVIDDETGLDVREEEGALVVEDRFDSLVILAAGFDLPELSGPPHDRLAKRYRKHVERFDRLYVPPPGHDFAYREAEGKDEALVWVEMRGGDDDLLYVYDGVRLASEILLEVDETESKAKALRKHLWLTMLSEQPIERDPRRHRPASFGLEHVDLLLEQTAPKEARMEVTQTLFAQGRPRRVVDLQQFSESFNPKGVNNMEVRRYHVRSVRDETGRELAFAHDTHELLIDLGRTVAPEVRFRLTFVIDGDYLVRPLKKSYWKLGVGPFFPQPGTAGEHYTLRFDIRTLAPFVPFASGVEVVRTSEGGVNRLVTEMDRPVIWAAIVAGKYHVAEAERDGLKIRVASYAVENKSAMARLTKLAFEVIDELEPLLGPFPFAELTILEINDLGWGQAPPGLMFITREAFRQLEEVERQLGRRVNERFAHEIAHQYWGQVVKMPSREEQWLTESFAEYSSALYIAAAKGERHVKRMHHEWKVRARDARKHSNIPLANRLKDSKRRAALIYDKGAYLLWVLHERMGDEQFFEFLRTFQENTAGGFAETRDVVELLDRITGRAHADYFADYYWGTELPPEP